MKPKLCAICRTEYEPRAMAQKVCSPGCALEHVKQTRQKMVRRETRAARQRLKSKREWLKEAQAAFNRYIRLRDKDLPCISCGRFHDGQWHAGHYRTVGAAPHLRFNENNCAKQCAPCNNHKSGNVVEYRINLVRRIGMEAVEALENDNEVRRWTVEEIRVIKERYSLLARQMERGGA